MDRGVVVDSNVMNLFNQGVIEDETTDARQLVEKIEATHGFAIDAGGKIRQQWLETCDSVYFGTWFTEGLKTGRIHQVAPTISQADAKHLRITCGMPRARFEFTYVAVANRVTQPRYIVTEDIDFWEPKAKTASHERKEAIKATRTGCVCKHLGQMGIAVGTVAQGLVDL